jgi:hypothetical protein
LTPIELLQAAKSERHLQPRYSGNFARTHRLSDPKGMSRNSGSRKENRIEAVYPVRLWGMDSSGKPFMEAAATLNVSRSGALLKDAPAKLSVGDTVGLRSGDRKCRFEVIWVGRSGTLDSGYLGLKSVEDGKNVWDPTIFDGSEEEIDTYIRPPQRENRLLARLKCSLSAEVGSDNSASRARTFITDISIGGCYVSMPSPCQVESKLTIALWLDDRTKVWMDGIVISHHKGLGMGVKFLNLSRKNFEGLNRMITQLSESNPLSVK